MKLLDLVISKDKRSLKTQKNILGLFFNKIIAMFISFQLIPATIGYIDSTQYGIWITISSLATWMLYFDFGLTHGFRNGFAVALAKDDHKLAKEYVSTTYVILILIFSILLLFGLFVNDKISWSSILGVSSSLDITLHRVFVILLLFLIIQMVGNIFTTLLLAIQKPALASLISTFGQILALLIIYILTNTTEGSLEYLAVALMGVPSILVLIISIFFFKTKLKNYSPSLKNVNLSLARRIIGLGSSFFIIQLAMLFVFQFSNFILIRLLGASSVTDYNVAYRYFSIIYIVMGVVYMPFWSAFTEAYTRKEYSWMNTTYKKLSKIWYLTFFIFFILLGLSNLVYKYWLAKDLSISLQLSFFMGLSMIIQARANLYMFCLNGIGKVRFQMFVYVFFAFISAPLMYFLTFKYGYIGILIVVSIIYLCQAIIGHIQLKKILTQTDTGIWSK